MLKNHEYVTDKVTNQIYLLQIRKNTLKCLYILQF